ncbi:hypothetical protein IGI04_037004 [Brassica rapa subsp. trilocularis]|uniref:Ovate family protein n=1 Tax=Brassica rapa subsp. trilocularis TaxID=1813537 RepID=A0ABQ7LG39_BRACM|nr:hypothetical protein IGI04_037004 [Brassica rapa subsp. trilocularis]
MLDKAPQNISLNNVHSRRLLSTSNQVSTNSVLASCRIRKSLSSSNLLTNRFSPLSSDDEDESLVSDEELDPKENLFTAGRVFLRDRPAKKKSKASQKSKVSIAALSFDSLFLVLDLMEKMSSHSSRTILANFPCDIHESGDPAMLSLRLVSINHDHRDEPSLSSSRFEDPIMSPFRLVSVNHDHREEPSLSSESRTFMNCGGDDQEIKQEMEKQFVDLLLVGYVNS